VTIGGVTDPSEIKRTYDDIEAIFKSNQTNYKIYEEHTPNGTFKSYTVEA